MKKTTVLAILFSLIFFLVTGATGYAAYHHEGENDANNFLTAYPDKAGTKLDHCALCHSGGSYTKSSGKEVSLGSCQWCHYTTSYGKENSNVDQCLNYLLLQRSLNNPLLITWRIFNIAM